MSQSIEHQQLSRFVGRWKTSGTIPSTENTPAIRISGTDTYEWLPGEFFLLHKADVMMGKDRSETFEVISVDKKSGAYTMQYYNNKGESGTMKATFQNEVWIFQGNTLRFTGSFKNSGNEFSGEWEQLNEKKQWVHLMDIKLVKE